MWCLGMQCVLMQALLLGKLGAGAGAGSPLLALTPKASGIRAAGVRDSEFRRAVRAACGHVLGCMAGPCMAQ